MRQLMPDGHRANRGDLGKEQRADEITAPAVSGVGGDHVETAQGLHQGSQAEQVAAIVPVGQHPDEGPESDEADGEIGPEHPHEDARVSIGTGLLIITGQPLRQRQPHQNGEHADQDIRRPDDERIDHAQGQGDGNEKTKICPR